MSLIGVHRFIARWAKLRSILALLAGCSALLAASTCPDQSLKTGDTVSKFKALDTQAEAAMRQRRPTAAIHLYKKAICLFPNSARGFYGLGVAQLAARDFTGARVSFQTADRLESTSPMPLIMQVRANFSLGDMKALKANLRDVSARFPNDEQAHTVLARFLAEKKLPVLALAEALRAEKASDGNPVSRVQLAVLENVVGAYDDSIDNATSVEQRLALPNETRAAAAGIAGLSYESLGEPEQAIQFLRKAIKLDASRGNSYLALADLYEQSQKYSDAVEVLKQARLQVGDSPAVLLPLGADLIRAGQYAPGIQILQNLLRQNPNIDQAYISLADAARRTGKAAEEVEALQGLERHNPHYPMLHLLIAQAMLRDAHLDYAGILRELSLAETSAPSDADIFYLRGKVLIALKRYREAISTLNRAAELRPTDVSTYYQLARLYRKLGNNDMAAKQFRKVKYIESAATK